MRRVLAALLAGVAVAVALAAGCGGDTRETDAGQLVDSEELVLAADHELYTVHRVTYGSVGAAGQPVLVTGVVFQPSGEPPEGGWPVLAFGHGTTGGADRCAPSRPANVGALAVRAAPFVEAGYVVAATDYEGLGTRGAHTYLHGGSAGRAMTDAVRAARELVPSTSRRWAAFGHSQGGHAALFTAEVAPGHAPELELVGAVATAPAGDPGALMVNPLVGRNFEALLLAGWLAAEPEVDGRVLTPAGEAAVEAVGRRCHVGTEGAPLASGQEAFNEYLLANRPGQERTDVPMLVLHGGDDQLVTLPVVEQLLERACDAGSDVELVVEPEANHSTILGLGVPIALDWLADRFAGAPTDPDC